MGLPSWHWPQVPASWMVVKCVQGVAVGAPVHWYIGALVSWFVGALVHWCIGARDVRLHGEGWRHPAPPADWEDVTTELIYCILYIIYLYIAAPGSRWLRRCNNKVLAVANWGPADQRVGISVQIHLAVVITWTRCACSDLLDRLAAWNKQERGEACNDSHLHLPCPSFSWTFQIH